MWLYVYLPYSVAFFALGLVMAMTARAPVPVLPRAALWLLAAFGLLHGMHEWTEMAILIQARTSGDGGILLIYQGDLIFAAASFAFLMQSGFEILISLRRWPKWLRAVPVGLLLIWLAAILVAQPLDSVANAEWTNAADALVRYILGFPGSLLVAYSILLMASRERRETGTSRIRTYLIGGAVAFAAYAFLTGLVVTPAPFPPASLINSESFLAVVGVPVEAFRAALALAIGGFLAEACVVEAAWIQRELERLREEFISTVAHDLPSPITAIKLSVGVLERLIAGGHDTEREREMLENIETNTGSLSRMAEKILNSSRGLMTGIPEGESAPGEARPQSS